MLEPAAIGYLLSDLSSKLGFCLPPEAQRRLPAVPAMDADAFADAVFAEEGMDPRYADRQLYRQLLAMVRRAFARSAAAHLRRTPA